MGRNSGVQLLLEDNTWSTQYNIPKIDRFSDSSTDWKIVNINFPVKDYGIKLIFDQINTPHAVMCFSIITVTHSVYWMDYVYTNNSVSFSIING